MRYPCVFLFWCVAVAIAAKQIHEAFLLLGMFVLLREHLPSRLRQQRRPPSSGRDGERRKANATSEAAARSDASALSAFSFSGSPLTTNSPTMSRKNYKVLSSRHIEKGEIEILNLFFYKRIFPISSGLCATITRGGQHLSGSKKFRSPYAA